MMLLSPARLPESFGKLTALKALDFTSCRELTALPESLKTFKNLNFLKLFDCRRLIELPSWIGDMQSLETLILVNNPFNELPNSIGNLKSLKKFFMENCVDLEDLPDSITRLTGLTRLSLENPVLSFPTMDTLLHHFGKTLNYNSHDFGGYFIWHGVGYAPHDDIGCYSDDSDAFIVHQVPSDAEDDLEEESDDSCYED